MAQQRWLAAQAAGTLVGAGASCRDRGHREAVAALRRCQAEVSCADATKCGHDRLASQTSLPKGAQQARNKPPCHLGEQQAEGRGAGAHDVRQQRRLPQRRGVVRQGMTQDGAAGIGHKRAGRGRLGCSSSSSSRSGAWDTVQALLAVGLLGAGTQSTTHQLIRATVCPSGYQTAGSKRLECKAQWLGGETSTCLAFMPAKNKSEWRK